MKRFLAAIYWYPYKSSVILLLATFNNFFHSYVINEYFPYEGSAADFIHKVQLSLILLAGMTFTREKINYYAFSAYLAIVQINWLFNKWAWFRTDTEHSIAITTSIAYVVPLIVVLIRKEWN